MQRLFYTVFSCQLKELLAGRLPASVRLLLYAIAAYSYFNCVCETPSLCQMALNPFSLNQHS